MNHEDRDQLREAKAKYCRFLDSRQWDAFEAIFRPDARIRILDPDGELLASFDGRDGFVESARTFLEGSRSIHQVHNDELTSVSDDEVAAIWSMEDYIVYVGSGPGQVRSLHGYGHYFESWRREPEGWRLASLELRRTILEKTCRSEER